MIIIRNSNNIRIKITIKNEDFYIYIYIRIFYPVYCPFLGWISDVAAEVAGPFLRSLVAVDAFLVMSGSVLTSYVGVTGRPLSQN